MVWGKFSHPQHPTLTPIPLAPYTHSFPFSRKEEFSLGLTTQSWSKPSYISPKKLVKNAVLAPPHPQNQSVHCNRVPWWFTDASKCEGLTTGNSEKRLAVPQPQLCHSLAVGTASSYLQLEKLNWTLMSIKLANAFKAVGNTSDISQ